MAISEQITCDVCGKTKGSVNHWWLVFEGPAQSGEYFSIYTWGPAEFDKFKHICGAECAVKALSEWMQSGKRAE